MLCIDFGLLLGPEEANLCRRVAFKLNKIEQELRGHLMTETVSECGIVKWKQKYEHLFYYPYHGHVDNLVVNVVNDLHVISSEIEEIKDPEVYLFFKRWYYKLKTPLCKNDAAQAYYLNR
jgi:hypothetical protein